MQYRYEWKAASVAYKSLKGQHDYLKGNWRELYDNIFLRYFSRYWKFLDGDGNNIDSLDEFRASMGVNKMIEDIQKQVSKSLNLGYKTAYRRFKDIFADVGITFDIQNPEVVNYINNFRALHLSTALWSISKTTKDSVIEELRKGVTERLSYWEISKNITALSSFIFSKTRAKLIAVNEIGNAYEYGNYVPMYEAEQRWLTVKKYRQTVEDSRVTPECTANQTEWRVPLNHIWSSGDNQTTRDDNPRCRCTSLFGIK